MLYITKRPGYPGRFFMHLKKFISRKGAVFFEIKVMLYNILQVLLATRKIHVLLLSGFL